MISVENRQIFPPRVFNATAEGVPLGIGYRRRDSKAQMMMLPNGQTSFKIGLVVLTQYRL